MTREEAIKHLETYSTTNGSGQTTQAQHKEAKQMAIEALEQEPCEDAISRADAIDLFGHGREWTEQEAQEAIRGLPPIRSICRYQQNDNVLEDIKAEIKELSNANPSYWHTCDVVERESVLDIIDKYIRAESEVRNDTGKS